MVKVFNKNKFGFSLPEVLVSMLIISVFFLASAKIITTRTPKESVKYLHGFFECYRDGGILYTHKLYGNAESNVVENAANCNFQTPYGVNFINVHYVNDDDGVYFNSQEPIVDMEMNIQSPESIMLQYFQNHNTEDINYDAEREQNECFKDDLADFGLYLKAAHPKSKIYEMWNSSGSYPSSSLFIAW